MAATGAGRDGADGRLGRRIEAELRRRLDGCGAPPPLDEAMRYSVLDGGKRIRARLVYLTCEALGAAPALADAPAAAIELMHASSLIHDDLPAMDDDDYRRGRPSCHVAYGEATAILAGDTLQMLAFQVLAEDRTLPPGARLEMLEGLARAAGGAGMMGGQMLDLAGERRRVDRGQLERMHRMKTGALISLAAGFGGMAAGAGREAVDTLRDFGSTLGLAFQVRDDILDATGTDEALGKPGGSDEANGKSTFVTTLGLPASRQALDELLAEARECIARLRLADAGPLLELAEFVAARDR